MGVRHRLAARAEVPLKSSRSRAATAGCGVEQARHKQEPRAPQTARLPSWFGATSGGLSYLGALASGEREAGQATRDKRGRHRRQEARKAQQADNRHTRARAAAGRRPEAPSQPANPGGTSERRRLTFGAPENGQAHWRTPGTDGAGRDGRKARGAVDRRPRSPTWRCRGRGGMEPGPRGGGAHTGARGAASCAEASWSGHCALTKATESPARSLSPRTLPLR
jgi:hypothetical protein